MHCSRSSGGTGNAHFPKLSYVALGGRTRLGNSRYRVIVSLQDALVRIDWPKTAYCCR